MQAFVSVQVSFILLMATSRRWPPTEALTGTTPCEMTYYSGDSDYHWSREFIHVKKFPYIVQFMLFLSHGKIDLIT